MYWTASACFNGAGVCNSGEILHVALASMGPGNLVLRHILGLSFNGAEVIHPGVTPQRRK